ncbi:diguanylate cyclase [Alkalimarinus alittae]|uniref:diguanylate cyclase n=1 Tax=Alkalimarinus alittae TaxID=2961619 RepID=A0ABY6MYI5_9ALTE|nr:diguanylate cyclase [Alkalimarinus alittae]UZE94883.1 diguanylate cyclase [Alkalimarinus alittae]
MKKFLVVEDSPIVVKIIKHIAKLDPSLRFDIAASFDEAKTLLNTNGPESYLAAVIDLNLPDAPDGEVVDHTLSLKIPTIVLTGTFDEKKRDEMLQKPIVDYVVKESRFSYEYVLKLIHRLHKNQHIKVLVVDDSKTSRNIINAMLKPHLYQLLEAEDGQQALDLINKDPSIKLLITDYNMPVMNGFDLVKNIRREVNKNALIIIGLSTQGSEGLSAKFIKNGANDFLYKPFSHEELHCRIIHNIEAMEHLETIQKTVHQDHVTGIFNRRYFYEKGCESLHLSQTSNTPTCLALIGIDHFKKINDEYGHEAGDQVLKETARLLEQVFNRFIFARMGGAEFCVLLSGLDINKAGTLMENFRELIEDHIIMLDNGSTTITISAGVALNLNNTLDQLMNEANRQLYNAKESGRNQVCIAD